MKLWPSRSATTGTNRRPARSVRVSVATPSMGTSGPTNRPPVAAATSPAVNLTRGTLPRMPDVTRLLVLYGGQSAEHEVSCVSAESVLKVIDRDRYDVTSVLIGKDGTWESGDPFATLAAAD